MTDYISREAAKKAMCRMCEGGAKLVCGRLNDCCTTMRVFDAIPAADVRPVVRGKWTATGAGCLTSKCSVCGYKSLEAGNFCPNCGADMRETNDEKA